MVKKTKTVKDKIVEVEKPFKEVFEKNGLKITVEKVAIKWTKRK